MAESNTNTKNKEAALNEETDFYKDAQDFLTTQLPEDFQEKILEYAKSKNYNRNEFRLFMNMMEAGISLHGTMLILKFYH